MRMTVFVLLVVGGISAACRGPDPSYRQVAVFVDLTEIEQHGASTQLQDDAIIEGILNLVTSGENPLDGAAISVYTLSDESITRRLLRRSLDVGKFGENRLTRMDDVSAFRDSVRAQVGALVQEIVKNLGQSTTPDILGYQQSHIVRPICDYLRTANSVNNANVTGSNYLIIFSDLLENSVVYTFYGPEGDALEALSAECSAVPGPIDIEYQVLQQPLPTGMTELQFEALQTWRTLFDSLGLTENTDLID